MANNKEAFVRLLTSIPKFEAGPAFSTQKVMDYYRSLATEYNSEIFLKGLLFDKIEKVAKDQVSYEKLYLKAKEIARLVDQISDIKQ